MNLQEPTIPWLKQIGRPLLIGEKRARAYAEKTGHTVAEIQRRARRECAPKPKGPPGAPRKDLVAMLNDHYCVPNDPIKSVRDLLARHAVIKAVALTFERKRLTDDAADAILVASFGKPTKPFTQTPSGKTIAFNTYHLKNMRCSMKRPTYRAGQYAVPDAVRERQEYHAWGERCGEQLEAMLSMGV